MYLIVNHGVRSHTNTVNALCQLLTNVFANNGAAMTF